MANNTLVYIDMNKLLGEFARQLKSSKRATLVIAVVSGYLIATQAAKIQTLTEENKELKKIKEE